MNRLLLLGAAAPLLIGLPAWAQDDPHAGHNMPAQTAPVSPAPAADPHAGHDMSAMAPEPPTDHAADRFYGPEAMAAARAQLRTEHGDIRFSKLMIETAEIRPASGDDGFAWEAQFSYGGDINRFVLATEGEGEGKVEAAEVQALYSRAISPYFNLQAGVRHDFEPGPTQSFAVIGVEGLAPYWFEVSGMLFLSDETGLSARIEGSHYLRLTQRMILESRAEISFAAEDDTVRAIGSGLSNAELGLRLRYQVTPTVAPYVGVEYERAFGSTASFARSAGEDISDTRLVIGLRGWF